MVVRLNLGINVAKKDHLHSIVLHYLMGQWVIGHTVTVMHHKGTEY